MGLGVERYSAAAPTSLDMTAVNNKQNFGAQTCRIKYLGMYVEGIRARADVFDDQILRHILSFVPGSSELAPKYSLQPETGHYLVKAGWPVVLKKMCHWKEADTTICICCGANQEPGDPNESDDSWTSQQVSAGWAKVMTVTIPHFRHHHMKYIKKQSEA